MLCCCFANDFNELLSWAYKFELRRTMVPVQWEYYNDVRTTHCAVMMALQCLESKLWMRNSTANRPGIELYTSNTAMAIKPLHSATPSLATEFALSLWRRAPQTPSVH